MPAAISHLQLDTYFLKEISYVLQNSLDTIPERVTDTKAIGLAISDTTTPIASEPQGWRCELIIESTSSREDEHPFYKFKIVMVGFFRVSERLNSAQAKLLAESNCPAVLFSTSREIIATVTRRSPFPATLLPLVTFIKIEDNKQEMQGTIETEAAPVPQKKPARKKSNTSSSSRK